MIMHGIAAELHFYTTRAQGKAGDTSVEVPGTAR